MGNRGTDPTATRARIGWWLFVLGLVVVTGYVLYSFIGMLVLGVFGYYATRPINRRIEARMGSDSLAALSTVLLVLVPLVALLASIGFQLFGQADQLLDGAAGGLPFEGVLDVLSDEERAAVRDAVRNPRELLGDPEQVQTGVEIALEVTSAIFGGILLVSLSVTLTYFLLQHDDDLATGMLELFGGEDTTAYAFATAVDEDLESVFFGNFLFVLVMSLVAAVAYAATNLFAPDPLEVPMIFVLAFLTGVASLIPIVVSKVVYLPVVAYLAARSVSAEGDQLPFVGGVLVAYFLVLDILPQTFLQPYITGRQLDMMVLLFAYLLGPVLFGWYGFFLLPILFVLVIETVRIVLPELVHGEAVTPTVEMGESVGSTPASPDDGVSERDGDAPDGTPSEASE